MTEESSVQVPEDDETRVKVRTRVVRRGEVVRVTTDPLRSALREAERRFLASQSSRAAGESPDVLSDYLFQLNELGRIDEALEDIGSRRDISYLTDRRLRVLADHCRWLSRRVTTEFLLVLQVHLEQELRRAIGPEAYQMFLRFEEVEGAAREIEALPDDALMMRLREGTLFRDVLAQVRLGDIVGPPRGPGPAPSIRR
jgi:hypothetical protein